MRHFRGVIDSIEAFWVILFFQTDWGGGWDTSEEHLFPGCALDLQGVLVTAAAPGIFLGKVSFVTLVGLKGARVYMVLRNW